MPAKPRTTGKNNGAVPLNMVGGRLVSKRSKTGDPACSQAMSSWVRARHGGPAVAAAVFKVLAQCRAKARQNKQASAQQQSGKLAPGRGTWQRSAQAQQLQGQRRGLLTHAAQRTFTRANNGTLPAQDVEARSMRLDRLGASGLSQDFVGKIRARRAEVLKAQRAGVEPKPLPGMPASARDTAARPSPPAAPGRGTPDRLARAAAYRDERANSRIGREALAKATGSTKDHTMVNGTIIKGTPGNAPQARISTARFTAARNAKAAQLRDQRKPTPPPAAPLASGRGTRQRLEKAIELRDKRHSTKMIAKIAAASNRGNADPEKAILGMVRGDGTFSRGGDVVRAHLAKLDEAGLGRLRAAIDAEPDLRKKAGMNRWLGGELRGEQRIRSRSNEPLTPNPHRSAPGRGTPERAFAADVLRAARAAKGEGETFGGNKAFIDAVHKRYAAGRVNGSPTLDRFKSQLSQANQSRHLNLSRADLVEAMPRDRVKASETSLGSGAATAHFVQTKGTPRGIATKQRAAAGAAKHKADMERMKAEREKFLADRDRPAPSAASTETPFSLKASTGATAAKFHSDGGRTKPLFEEMRGAGARDLPGQSTMFGARPDARSTPKSAKAGDLFARADKAWKQGKSEQAAGSKDAAGTFARHDEFMQAARRRLEQSKAASSSSSSPAPADVARSDWRGVVESSRKRSGAIRDRKARALGKQRAEISQARASTVKDLPSDQIHFDPDRFQYKLDANHGTGSVGSLSGVKRWDPELGGVLQVWKDPSNGKTYVVNGHNRLDLAKRLGAGKVSVRYLSAKDAQEARAKGAITNIAEGRGTSTDAAAFFRDTGLTRQDLEGRGVPMREKTATEGLALAGLEPGLWRAHKNGELPAARAAIIGGSGLSHAEQAAVHQTAGKGGIAKLSDRDLTEYIDNAKSAGKAEKRTASLFGDDVETVNLGAHRARIQSAVKDRLGREKRVFGTVAKSRNAEDLGRAGNVINATESGKVSQTAAENLAVFDTLKNRRGPVSDLLNEAAERIHKGESQKAVNDDVYKRLPAAVQKALAGG